MAAGHDDGTGTGTELFHRGERAAQARAGAADRFAGRRAPIRDFMPEQHREFFRQLPFIVAGSIDTQGQPWASILANPPGFIQSPDPHHLNIGALPQPEDPLAANLAVAGPIALLGIEPHTRRRNRMNGTVETVSADSFSVAVDQSFGNCPKYIQERRPEYISRDAVTTVLDADHLDAEARRMITDADTFFIASAYAHAPDDRAPAHGVDISHRGGYAGFVRVDGNTLTVPDFIGNFYFNTLGNILVNPRAGLLFVDFTNGDLLYLAAEATIIWDGAEVMEFPGAQRLLRLRIRTMRRATAVLPLRWSEAAASIRSDQP
jgi:uncharacterized protein